MYSVTFVTSDVDYTYRVSAVNAVDAIAVARLTHRVTHPNNYATVNAVHAVSI